MRIRFFIISILIVLILAIQASYVALVEGAILWWLWNLFNNIFSGSCQMRYFIAFGIAFIPNFIYTVIKTR
jgi:hypothetical protein